MCGVCVCGVYIYIYIYKLARENLYIPEQGMCIFCSAVHEERSEYIKMFRVLKWRSILRINVNVKVFSRA